MKVDEKELVKAIASRLAHLGYCVATEVANFHRSADIAAIDSNGCIWIIECKVSSMKKAIQQSKTHKLSADKVFIGTSYKNTKSVTINKIREEGLGLIYVMPNGEIQIAVDEQKGSNPWQPARERLRQRILGCS